MKYQVEATVRWVEMETEEEEIAWRASLRMLLDMLDNEKDNGAAPPARPCQSETGTGAKTDGADGARRNR